MAPDLLVGVDTGGTFTDIVYRLGAKQGRLKVLSTPADPAAAVLAGLTQLFPDREPDLLTYGTTVATNAMLERRGARTALVTTAGFEDVLAIGRQARPQLYELEPLKPEPLVPAALRFGVNERATFDGQVLKKLTKTEIVKLRKKLAAAGVESVAVCLLHAAAFDGHEKLIEKELSQLGVPLTLSSVLSPQSGEYERSSTVAANAYVRPKLEHHITELARRSRALRFRVMQSSGGAIAARQAAQEPIRTMLSGPAGGVAAAAALGKTLGLERLVTFDMGGTSTDVALVAGDIPQRPLTFIGDIPIRTPSIDIHTVGAGGGSIAWVDEGGSLKVGPHSAGADPGPACYGRGRSATVTDANLALGRLRPDRFLGGQMQLNLGRANEALSGLAKAIGAASVAEAAEGVVRVAEGSMERAIRVITVERGEDPRSCALVSFGGAAALHACGLADTLGMSQVVIPSDAGLFSALGVLDGTVQTDNSLALRVQNPSETALRRAAVPLSRDAKALLAAEGIAKAAIDVKIFARLRYLGQSLELEVELNVELAANLRERFDAAHQQRFHYHDNERTLEAVGLRVCARGLSSQSNSPSTGTRQARGKSTTPDILETARVFSDGRERRTPIYDRDSLRDCRPGKALVEGPAVITEYSSTLWVPKGWQLSCHEDGHLLLNRRQPRGRGSR
jgi:N-methylhydantoinase A